MPTLEEIKVYLGIDGEFLDSLLADLLKTAQDLIEKVLRYPISDFDVIPPAVKETAKLIVSAYYNNRENTKQNELESFVAISLSRYRKVEF